jgi:hypothetical protein
MHYFNDVHDMNAHRGGHICPSVRMIQVENRLTNLDEIWYGRYATGANPKIVIFNFLQSVLPPWQMHKLLRWDQQ